MSIKELQAAVGCALVDIDRYLFDISNVRILSGERNRQLLNALLGYSKPLHYLEVGAYCGGSFAAAMFKNKHVASATVIDSWAEKFGGGAKPREEFMAAYEGYVPKEIPFTLLEQDCWSVTKLPHKPDVFYYDAGHTALDQERALTHFGPMCANNFIYLVDDYNWPKVYEGTRKGLKNFDIEFELEILSRTESDKDWWNGLGIFILSDGCEIQKLK